MTDYATWQRSNDEYLSLGVAWLRARLDAISPAAPAALPAPPPPASSAPGPSAAPANEQRTEPSLWDRLTSRERRTSGAAVAVPDVPPPKLIALPRPGAYDAVATAAELLRQMRELEAAEPPPALVNLAHRLGLTEFERNVMLLVCATELDTRVAAQCARAQDETTRPYPTFALAMALFDTPSWDVLSPERPLRFWRLVEITQPSGVPLMASVLRADERIVNYVKGLNYLDDRLAPIATPLDVPPLHVVLPASHGAAVQRVVDALPRESDWGRVPMVQLTGADGPTKQLVAAHATAAVGRELYHVAAESLPSSAAEVELLARLWDREAALMPVAVYLDEPLADGPATEAASASLDRFASRVRSLAFVSSREPRPLRGTLPVLLDVSRATASEQRDAWRALLPDADATAPDRLSAQFDLSLPVIERVAEDARAGADGAAPSIDVLWRACLAATRPRLEQLARRIEPRATWDDLVLPAEQLGMLRQLVAQVSQRSRVYEDWGWAKRMNRGLGITALFAGESGTGKTMAAEVLASELRLDLYRIDLSGVVSKYIGETEKNLRRVFDAAEAGGALLLFDEADALFGKRSEVKDSHDRYANVEINYLLQRLEAFRGLAILTTNMKSAMDQAFTRRLRFVVDFPFPNVAERRRMWAQVFPAATECATLDVDRLARFALTGGSIHNVALNSAFLAAHAGEPVTMPRVLESLRGEYRKLARPASEADFRALVAEGAGARA
jgi:ATPase family associated with various cellular activities (AAA)